MLHRHWLRGRKSHGQLALLSLPGIVYVFILSYIPMFGIILAFEDFQYNKGIIHSPLVGLSNFRFFFSSPVFFQLVRNTILYNVAFVVFGTLLALGIAILAFMVRQHRRLVSAYQFILFMPYFLSFIVIAFIVQEFLSPTYGMVTHLVAAAGGGAQNYYADPSVWIVVLIAVQLWQTMGFSSLLYYTALLAIDPTLYEAAEVDGASRWSVARHVLIPQISPLIGILLILAIGGLANANFALFYFVPGNSPLLFSTTNVINTYVFRALTSGEISPPAAIGLVQSVVGLILVLFSNFIVRRVNPDAALF